jgi:uncharacterized protein
MTLAASPNYSRSEIDATRAGIGLRSPHYLALASAVPRISFFEVHSENYFGDGGAPLNWLTQFRERYPMSLHGVGLSLGRADNLDQTHLQKLKRLVDRFEPTLVSEHICWVGVGGRMLNDLLPVPYTSESLDLVVSHVQETQDFLQRKILVENVSSYLEFTESDIPEWEFVAEVAKRAGCGILLDVNNIYVNSRNHGFDADTYLNAIPADAVGEIHLAGFQESGALLIDTHGDSVSEAVWSLYEKTIAHMGAKPTLIEWDTNIPPLDVLLAEAEVANAKLNALTAQTKALRAA